MEINTHASLNIPYLFHYNAAKGDRSELKLRSKICTVLFAHDLDLIATRSDLFQYQMMHFKNAILSLLVMFKFPSPQFTFSAVN